MTQTIPNPPIRVDEALVKKIVANRIRHFAELAKRKAKPRVNFKV